MLFRSVVASMIGTGVFTTTGFLLADLKSGLWVVLVWLVGGVVAACGALCYGALAGHIPESGGEYVLLSRTLHPAAGYLAGWISLLAGFCAPLASAAIAFGVYASPFLPQRFPPSLWGLAVLAATALLHMSSDRRGTRIHSWMVAVVLVLIVCLAVFGLAHPQVPLAPVSSTPLPVSGFAVALVLVSYSYAGWNGGAYIAGEVRNPQVTLPRALLLGTAFTTVVYVALNLAFVRSAPMAMLAGKLQVGQIAAQQWGGPGLAALVSAVVATALAASVSALTLTGPRIIARMSQDGYLPRFLAPPPGGAPRAAIVAMFLLSAALAATATYKHLLTYIGVLLGLCNAATVVGLLRLRRRNPDLHVPGWPLVPAVFLLLVAWMIALTLYRQPAEALVGGLTLVLGWAAYQWQTRRGSHTTRS